MAGVEYEAEVKASMAAMVDQVVAAVDDDLVDESPEYRLLRTYLRTLRLMHAKTRADIQRIDELERTLMALPPDDILAALHDSSNSLPMLAVPRIPNVRLDKYLRLVQAAARTPATRTRLTRHSAAAEITDLNELINGGGLQNVGGGDDEARWSTFLPTPWWEPSFRDRHPYLYQIQDHSQSSAPNKKSLVLSLPVPPPLVQTKINENDMNALHGKYSRVEIPPLDADSAAVDENTVPDSPLQSPEVSDISDKTGKVFFKNVRKHLLKYTDGQPIRRHTLHIPAFDTLSNGTETNFFKSSLHLSRRSLPTITRSGTTWTPEEDQRLLALLEKFPPNTHQRFVKITDHLNSGKTHRQVAARVKALIDAGLAGPRPSVLPDDLESMDEDGARTKQPSRFATGHVRSTRMRVSGGFYLSKPRAPTVMMPDGTSYKELDGDDEYHSDSKRMRYEPPTAEEILSFDPELSEMVKQFPESMYETDEFKHLMELAKRRYAMTHNLDPETLDYDYTSAEVKEETTSDLVHIGFACDSCRQEPIFGVRYHCPMCPDKGLDFCEECARQSISAQTTPRPASEGVARTRSGAHRIGAHDPKTHQLEPINWVDRYWDDGVTSEVFAYLDPTFDKEPMP